MKDRPGREGGKRNMKGLEVKGLGNLILIMSKYTSVIPSLHLIFLLLNYNHQKIN